MSITVNSGFGHYRQPKLSWRPLALLLAICLIAICAMGCATVPRNRECRDGIVGLTSEVLGWESPPAAPGVPQTVKVTAHNGSRSPVRFTMACGPVGGTPEHIDVRLDPYHDKYYYFNVRFNHWEVRKTFACLIVRFGEHEQEVDSWSTTTDRSTP